MNGFKGLVAVITASVALTACASADQKIASKQDYRRAQIEAIKVQRQADAQAAEAQSAERVAMWEALGEAVKANPDAASHMAIVAAVSSTGNNSPAPSVRGNIVRLNEERETTAIDVLKVITPGLIGGVTQAGIAAIAAETTRDSIKANRDIRVKEIEVDGQLWGVLGTAITEAGDDTINYYSDNDTTTSDVTDVDVTEPSDLVSDDVTDVVDTSDDSTGDDVTDVTDDVVEPVEEPVEVDCSGPQFSPIYPACEQT